MDRRGATTAAASAGVTCSLRLPRCTIAAHALAGVAPAVTARAACGGLVVAGPFDGDEHPDPCPEVPGCHRLPGEEGRAAGRGRALRGAGRRERGPDEGRVGRRRRLQMLIVRFATASAASLTASGNVGWAWTVRAMSSELAENSIAIVAS